MNDAASVFCYQLSLDQGYIRLLKKKERLEQYEKSKEVYDQLKQLQDAAVARARERITALQDEHIEVLSRESNPVTTVAELVV